MGSFHALFLSILLERFSVFDLAVSGFASYLSDRFHRTAAFPMDCSVPQVSILGPHEFIAHLEEVIDVIRRIGPSHHVYADDMQFSDSCRPNETSNLLFPSVSPLPSDASPCCRSHCVCPHHIPPRLLQFSLRWVMSSAFAPLRHVQNAAGSPAVVQLHWLLVKYRITFNSPRSCIVLNLITARAACYLTDLCGACVDYTLHSADCDLFELPRLCTKLGWHAFSNARSSASNSITADIQIALSYIVFSSCLRTICFVVLSVL